MATPEKNTATPVDETLLDAMAAIQISRMSRRAQQIAAHSDAKQRRAPTPPSPPETPDTPPDDSPDDDAGAFKTVSEPPKHLTTPTPIFVDLPSGASSMEVLERQADVEESEDSTYQATEEPPKNLAEEILSQQMTDEIQTGEPETFESEFLPEEEEDQTPRALPDDEDPIEVMARQVDAPIPPPVRRRPVLGAIRPPAHPSRFRSLFLQALIVLMSLTAVGMIAYLMGILKL
jgi:hypothetical protein